MEFLSPAGYLLFWSEYQICFECGEKKISIFHECIYSTSENADIFTARVEIYLVFTDIK